MEKEEQDPPQYNKNKSVADMTSEERLRSLQAFAEEKKYIQPGGPELTPYNAISGGDGGFNSVIFGSPWQGPTSFKQVNNNDGPRLPPPSYNTVTGEGSKDAQPRKDSVFKRMFGKSHEKHDEKTDLKEAESK